MGVGKKVEKKERLTSPGLDNSKEKSEAKWLLAREGSPKASYNEWKPSRFCRL